MATRLPCPKRVQGLSGDTFADVAVPRQWCVAFLPPAFLPLLLGRTVRPCAAPVHCGHAECTQVRRACVVQDSDQKPANIATRAKAQWQLGWGTVGRLSLSFFRRGIHVVRANRQHVCKHSQLRIVCKRDSLFCDSRIRACWPELML